ncbi:MAG: hypothetical protein JXD23_04120 [Spirochaetales bacterium]|nr:hypothetical protein [Spirochaetales bacterium]
MNRTSLNQLFFGFFLLFAFVAECGYIDPGTGSYFIQILIGVLAGGLFALKIFWKKIIAFLRGENRKKTEPATPGASGSDGKHE